MAGHQKARWRDLGVDPDYRFSLANERTFLAWIRTALALLAGAVLVNQFATKIHPEWLHTILSQGLVLIAAGVSAGAYMRWMKNEIAMRHAQSLPSTFLLPFMTIAAIGLALLLGFIASTQS